MCASCHGLNSKDQLDQTHPTNTPSALVALLQFWKNQQAGVPSAPANFGAAAATTTTVQLSWTASAGATPATQYEIARASAGSPFATIQPRRRGFTDTSPRGSLRLPGASGPTRPR